MVAISKIEQLCKEIRRDVFKIILNAKSGHLGACSSSVELIAALYFGGILRYNPSDPQWEDRDRVVLRGHLGPLRYKIFSLIGWIDPQLLWSYRQLGSPLQGHESMELCPGVDITPSGSLGMCLSYGVGAAVAAQGLGKRFKTYVFLGDGEEQEGNINEAARHAVRLGVDNIVCIMDKNCKQLSRPTASVDAGDVSKIWAGYGWDVREIKDGHNLEEILKTYESVLDIKRPTLLIANTIKGKGLEGAEENWCGYHTISSCPEPVILKAIGQLNEELRGASYNVKELVPVQPSSGHPLKRSHALPIQLTESYSAPNRVVGDYWKKFAQQPALKGSRLYAMTADLLAPKLRESFVHNTRFIDVGIREQHMLAMAHGLAVTDPGAYILIIHGDPFIYRSADQLWSIAQGKDPVVILGMDAGLSWRENGATHHSTGQPGMLLTMPWLTLLEPADAVDTVNCLNYALCERSGPVYIRMHNLEAGTLSVEERSISYYVAYEPISPPDLALVASGLPVCNAILAAQDLAKYDISSRVISVVNAKTLDERFATLLAPNKPILTIYNGHPQILQSEVSRAIMEYMQAKPSCVLGHGFVYGTSGTLEGLVRHFRLDKDGIVQTIQKRFPYLFRHGFL